MVSDQSPGAPSYDDPAARGVLRVLAHHGVRVELHRHLPARGVAEHRDALARGLHERVFAWMTLGDERNLVQSLVAGVPRAVRAA